MFLSEWREFPSAPCLAGKNNMTVRVSMWLKSRVTDMLPRCFLPDRAKDLSAHRYVPKIGRKVGLTVNEAACHTSACVHDATIKTI